MSQYRYLTITGPDGSGKTTLIDHLNGQYPELPVMRYPPRELLVNPKVYWPSPRALWQLMIWADHNQHPHLKSVGLVMSMACYSHSIRQHLASNSVLAERHPVLDGLVYGPHYVTLMRKYHQSDDEILAAARLALSDEQLKNLLNEFLGWVPQNSPFKHVASISDLCRKVQMLFSLPMQICLENLLEFYQIPLDIVVLLSASNKQLTERINARVHNNLAQKDSTIVHELHEHEAALARLNESYTAVATALLHQGDLRHLQILSTAMPLALSSEQFINNAKNYLDQHLTKKLAKKIAQKSGDLCQ